MANASNSFEATEQMYALVGRCITQWSFVEKSLCNIFSICMSTVDPYPEQSDGSRTLSFRDSYIALSVFYAVESFRGKLGLVDAAVTGQISQCPMDGTVLTEWSRLKDKTRKLSLRRNKLAHWTVLPAYNHEGLHPARLVPPIGSPGFYRETGMSAGNATLKPLHLEHLDHAFCLLDAKLRAFAVSLATREELFDRSVRLLERRIRSLDHIDPTRAAQLRRALSSPE